MTTVPGMTMDRLLNRLTPPADKIRMVLDTDTYNEIDDQFAVAYALAAPERLQVEAIYAAPFYNAMSVSPGDGMEKSYREIERIIAMFGRSAEGFLYRGSDRYLPEAASPVVSAAAADLVERAMASPDDDPLYVLAIGAITNVASALLLEPRIAGKIVVVWLGGHALHWPDCHEFNLRQDVHAARIVLDSGVPLMLVPCAGVASHLITTLAEVERYLKGQGKVGDYLYRTFEQCREDHYAYSRVIWDVSAVAWLVEPRWVQSNLVHSPLITTASDRCRWSLDAGRPFIRCAHALSRDKIFGDLFRRIQSLNQVETL